MQATPEIEVMVLIGDIDRAALDVSVEGMGRIDDRLLCGRLKPRPSGLITKGVP